MHEDLIFDAAGGVGGQLDLLVRLEGIHGLDEADGTDGDEILDTHACVLKPPGDVHHQPEIVFDEGLLGRRIALHEGGDALRLLLGLEGRRQDVAAADVEHRRRTPQPQGHQNSLQQSTIHASCPPNNAL